MGVFFKKNFSLFCCARRKRSIFPPHTARERFLSFSPPSRPTKSPIYIPIPGQRYVGRIFSSSPSKRRKGHLWEFFFREPRRKENGGRKRWSSSSFFFPPQKNRYTYAPSSSIPSLKRGEVSSSPPDLLPSTKFTKYSYVRENIL